MNRKQSYLDLTTDYALPKERLDGLCNGDPHLQRLDNVALWMVAVLLIGLVIAVL